MTARHFRHRGRPRLIWCWLKFSLARDAPPPEPPGNGGPHTPGRLRQEITAGNEP